MKRIEVPTTEFEGQNNVYVLGDDRDGALALVDTAVREQHARDQIDQAFDRDGLSIDDVSDVLLTHYHWDHVGLAAEIQARSGATVHAPRGDAALIAGEKDAWRTLQDALETHFDEWAMPTSKQEDVLDSMVTLPLDDAAHPTVEPFDEGARFDGDWGSLEAIDLPGHTAGHAGFVQRSDVDGDAHLYAGDALLPEYTPNVGGADVRTDDALATYVRTLKRIENGGFERVLPGHRRPIDDPAARARTIRDHHVERTRRVIDVLETRGPATTWAVSDALFGTVVGIHVLHGPGEADAHLEHLRQRGVVSRDDGHYRLLERPQDVATLFE